MIPILRGACFAMACAVIGSAGAAGTDELWEITTQMNMPGMPAGMGAQTQQVCSEKGDTRKAAERNMEKCKLTDYKESGNRVTMTVSCPEGTGVIDNTYNAARTEYTGTMKMSTAQGEMSMNMRGRKVGSCDAQQAQAARATQAAAMEAQAKRAQADSAKAQADHAAYMQKHKDDAIAKCAASVDTMDMRDLRAYATCQQRASGNWKPEAASSSASDAAARNAMEQVWNMTCDNLQQDKRTYSACATHVVEYCKRYQTMEGFLKAKGSAEAAKACNVARDELQASFCPRAAETENLEYLGRFCPSEAKPLAKQHCAGRSFTSRQRDKYTDFCAHYLAHHDLDEDAPAPSSQPRPGTVDPKQAITEGVTQGVTQGINKLRGLFGR